MGLVAENQEDDSTQIIEAIAPWPAISVGEFNQHYKLPNNHGEKIIIISLCFAQVFVGRQLKAAADVLLAEPLEDMDEVNLLYVRAVSSKAKALMISEYITYARREVAENAGKESDETQDYYHSAMQEAIDLINDIVLGEVAIKANTASVHLI